MFFFGFLRIFFLINLVVALLGFYGLKTFIYMWLGVFGLIALFFGLLVWLSSQPPQISDDLSYARYDVCSNLVYNKGAFPTITKCMASAGVRDWIK